jgi:hypothetical protein
MSGLIPFMLGGFIYIIKSPFSAIEKAKDEYTKIITAYIAVGHIPSKNDLTDLKHMVARKHNIAAYDLPKMQTVLDSSYCSYWASEKIDTKRKIPFNNHFSFHREAFIKNDLVIPRAPKDWRQKICLEFVINLLFAAGLAFILLLSTMASDPKATASFDFFETSTCLFFYSALGQIFFYLFQRVVRYFRPVKK